MQLKVYSHRKRILFLIANKDICGNEIGQITCQAGMYEIEIMEEPIDNVVILGGFKVIHRLSIYNIWRFIIRSSAKHIGPTHKRSKR